MVTFTQWDSAIRTELFKRKITVNSGCVMCEEGEETLGHLFTKYPFARALWFASPLNIRADSIPSEHHHHQWLKMILEEYKADHVHGMSLVQESSAMLWTIWINRYPSCYSEKVPNRMATINRTGGTEQTGSQ